MSARRSSQIRAGLARPWSFILRLTCGPCGVGREINLLPRFVAVWLDAGLMDEDEAAEWLVRGKAWAEYRRIGAEICRF